MPNILTTWLEDAASMTKPKPLEQAKALRQRKKRFDSLQRGEGNIFQRRRQGVDEVEQQAVGP